MGKFLKRGRNALLLAALLLVSATAAFGSSAFADGAESSMEIELPQGFGAVTAAEFFPYQNGFLFAAKDGKTSCVLYLEEDGTKITQTHLDFSYDSAVLQGSDLYLSESEFDYVTEQGHVFLHKLSLNGGMARHETILLQKAYFSGQNTFCVDSAGRIYALSMPASSRLTILDGDGSQLGEIRTAHGRYHSIFLSPDGFLYAIYNNYWDKYGCISTDSVVLEEDLPLIDGEAPIPPARFLQESYLIGQDGGLFFKEEDGSLVKVLETETENACACLAPDGVVIGRVRKNTAVKFGEDQKLQYQFNGSLLGLASCGDTQAALVENGDRYYFYKLSDVPTEPLPDENPDPPEPPEDDPLWESTYPIDPGKQAIFIDAGVSFAGVKATFAIPDGYTLKARKPNGAALTSGYAGTGTVIELCLDGTAVDSLTVIARGDLNGTGMVTSSDERLLYNYLNGSEILSDYGTLAADLNRDGGVDVLDLLQIKKLINR